MRIILSFILITSLLFPVGGVVIFNDGTTIEGDIIDVNQNSVSITPDGLTFPENILMENIDSLKLYDGEILVANNNVRLLYTNGEFSDPAEVVLSNQADFQDYDVEYVVIPNWSLNFYTGYPLFKAASFEEFDKSNLLFGLSVGSPFGIFAGDFFMNLISEFIYYNFQQSNNTEGQNFGGPAIQVGLSPGFFIGEASFSLTACTGIYQNDKGEMTSGFIAGGSFDIPLANLISGYVDIDEDDFPLELRLTSRSNIINKDEGATGWVDFGVSFGYEF